MHVKRIKQTVKRIAVNQDEESGKREKWREIALFKMEFHGIRNKNDKLQAKKNHRNPGFTFSLLLRYLIRFLLVLVIVVIAFICLLTISCSWIQQCDY